MQNIQVHRYSNPGTQKFWQGWVEPDDRSWIMFVDAGGHVSLFDERDPETGAVLDAGAYPLPAGNGDTDPSLKE